VVSSSTPILVNGSVLIDTPGMHVLLLDRVIRTRDGRPAEWRQAECVLRKMHYLAVTH
jgi:hypothetical protein